MGSNTAQHTRVETGQARAEPRTRRRRIVLPPGDE